MKNKFFTLKTLIILLLLSATPYLGIMYLNKQSLDNYKNYCIGLTDSTLLVRCVEGNQRVGEKFPQEIYDLFYNQIDNHYDYKFYYGLNISYGFCERKEQFCNVYDKNILQKYLLKCSSKMVSECSLIYFRSAEFNDESLSLFIKNILIDKEKIFICRDEFKKFYKKIPEKKHHNISYSCDSNSL